MGSLVESSQLLDLNMAKLLLPLLFAVLSCVAVATAGVVGSNAVGKQIEEFECKDFGFDCSDAMKLYDHTCQTICPDIPYVRKCRFKDETLESCFKRQSGIFQQSCYQCICPYMIYMKYDNDCL